MTTNEEDEQTVKVVDKRRFNADGESVADSSDEDRAAAEPKPDKVSADSKNTEEDYNQQVTFSAFIMGLATQVLICLGEIPDPMTNQKSKNIVAARQTIDVLSLLQEKTHGNVTVDEKKLLYDMLGSLRLAYVEAVKK